VSDKLKSYAAAKRKILPNVEHRQSRFLNHRAEVSHQPTRRRERQMQRFKSARHLQRFLSAHSRIHNHFQLHRHHLSASQYRAARNAAFRSWRQVGEVALAATFRVAFFGDLRPSIGNPTTPPRRSRLCAALNSIEMIFSVPWSLMAVFAENRR
jgi:putative transposase